MTNEPLISASWLSVITERKSQIEHFGWTAEHDDKHTDGELALAATCYAIAGRQKALDYGNADFYAYKRWPWDRNWWKPKSIRQNLVKAAALLIAEIERLDRKNDAKTT